MSAAYWTLMAVLTLVWPLHARASPSYPTVIDDVLELGCRPACDLCHVNKPGYATANTPLGIATRRAKLRCCDDDGLASVLEQLETSGIDSDEDGIGDMEELRAREDPNVPATTLTCERAELIGDGSRVFGTCAASPHAPGSPGLEGTTLLVAAAILIMRLRGRS